MKIFGIMFVYGQGRMTTVYGAMAGNLLICTALLIGTIMTSKQFVFFPKSMFVYFYVIELLF